MGLFDGVGDLLSGASDWFGRNEKWLKPVVSTAFNLYGNQKENNTSSAYVNELQKAQTDDYNNQKANYDAYTTWLQSSTADSNAASRAAAAASNAKSAANEKSRVAGVNAAKGVLGQTYDKMKKYIDPYADMGLRVRPAIENTYMGALKALTNLTAQETSPEAMKQWNQSKPAWEVGAPLPDWMRRT